MKKKQKHKDRICGNCKHFMKQSCPFFPMSNLSIHQTQLIPCVNWEDNKPLLPIPLRKNKFAQLKNSLYICIMKNLSLYSYSFWLLKDEPGNTIV